MMRQGRIAERLHSPPREPRIEAVRHRPRPVEVDTLVYPQRRGPDPGPILVAVHRAQRRAAELMDRAAQLEQPAWHALACSAARLAARREREHLGHDAAKMQGETITDHAHDTGPGTAEEQAEIDAEMAASAHMLRASDEEREADLKGREHSAGRRDEAADRRDDQAAQRQTILDDQQRMADEHGRLLDQREVQLDKRERIADQREIDREIAVWNDKP